MLEQGPVEKTILEQCLREGLKIPDKIAGAPELVWGLGLYYTAFGDLMSSRQTGFGIGPIPWDAIQGYCDHHRLDADQTEAMHFHIQSMDAAFLEYHRRKTPTNPPSSGGSS